MRILIGWAVGIVAIVLVVFILNAIGLPITWAPDNHWGIVFFVPVLALTNAFLGTLLRVLSLPLTCLTFGLFSFIINALVFKAAGSLTGASMSFPTALVGSILYAFISSPLSSAIKDRY